MPTAGLNQEEVDRLLREFSGSGVHIAMAKDVRYQMRLRIKAGILWLIIEGMVMQPIPDEFSSRLQQLCEKRQIGRAAIDLTRCTYLCSGAIGLIAQLLCSDRSSPDKVLLLGATAKIQHVISLVGLNERFQVVATQQDAARYWIQQGAEA
jgi:anti-anti-sigma regulatory factor